MSEETEKQQQSSSVIEDKTFCGDRFKNTTMKTPQMRHIQSIAVTTLKHDADIFYIWLVYISETRVYKLLWDGTLLFKSGVFRRAVKKISALTDSSILAIEFDDNVVYQVDSDGAVNKYYEHSTEKSRIEDIAVSSETHLFVLLMEKESSNNLYRVIELDPSGTELKSYEKGMFGSRLFKNPIKIAVDSDTLLVVYNKDYLVHGPGPKETLLMSINTKNNSKTKISKRDSRRFRNFVGAKCSGVNCILLADNTTGSVVKFDTQQKTLEEILDLELITFQEGLKMDCFDAAGKRVFAAFGEGIIRIVTCPEKL